MFTNSCFINKNTPELREKLNNIGYRWGGEERTWGEKEILYCAGMAGRYFECVQKPSRYETLIDCGENIDLFLAIASLRDDTDKYQWFTDGKITEMSADDMPSKYMQLEGHKCTVEELIEFFTKPKNEGFLSTETLKRIGGLKIKKL